jgi:uncharacterized cupin superfamily protein
MASTLPAFEAHAVPRGGEGLDRWPVTTEELEGSEMWGRVLWRSADGTRATGVWHATPGTIRGTFLTDEVSYVVEGRLTVVTPDDGAGRDVRAGDVMVMSAGLTVEWRIHEPMTKLWNVFHPDGLPF